MRNRGPGGGPWGPWPLVLALAYAPNFRRSVPDLEHDDPNYSHGFLVIPIALFILWRRFTEMPWEPGSRRDPAPWWGWVLLATVLVGAGRRLRAELAVGGDRDRPAGDRLPDLDLRRPCRCCSATWPAILFLVFMLPLPNAVNDLISLPLQRIAATGSYFLLQLSGFWVIQQGNVLRPGHPVRPCALDVALACNGLKMLMTLAATVTATILLLPLPTWKRIVLLVSAVPIALISNIIRIVATGWCYYYIEGETGQGVGHTTSPAG